MIPRFPADCQKPNAYTLRLQTRSFRVLAYRFQTLLLFGHLTLLGESFLNVALDFRAAHQTEDAINDLAVTANVESRRQILNSAILGADFFFPDQNGIIHAQLMRELSNPFWSC